MRDRQGVLRGACSQCACKDYQTPASGNACDYCGHYPVAHQESAASSSSVAPMATLPATVVSTPPPPRQSPAAAAVPPQRAASAREQYSPTMPSVAVTAKPKTKHKNPVDWLLHDLHTQSKKKRS